MTDTQVQEGCKLIAEFMGMKHTKTLFDSHGYEQYNYTMPDELSKQVYGYTGAECFLEDQFSKSWDWLMPVVEKIEKSCIVCIWWDCCEISAEKVRMTYPAMIQTRAATKIEAVWQAVIDFIKLYNQSK